MTNHQINLIQRSFLELTHDASFLTNRFYSKLFEVEPKYRAMFQNEMQLQGDKFMKILGIFVQNLYSLNEDKTDLLALGQRHIGYGVSAQDYQVVGDVLLSAIAESLNDSFDQEMESAWLAMYERISYHMKQPLASLKNSA